MSTEEKESEIIKVIFSPSYSHAEEILLRLSRLQGRMSHAEAIHSIHSELTSE